MQRLDEGKVPRYARDDIVIVASDSIAVIPSVARDLSSLRLRVDAYCFFFTFQNTGTGDSRLPDTVVRRATGMLYCPRWA